MSHLDEQEQTYKLAYSKYKTCEWKYSFTNRQPENVEVWVSVPVKSQSQQNIRKLTQTPPDEIHHFHQHTQLYYRLAPGERIHLCYLIDLYQVQLHAQGPSTIRNSLRRWWQGTKKFQRVPAQTLSTEEEQFYLRSTRLVPVDEATKEEAQIIVGDEIDPIEQAYALFNHLTQNYRYHYPPQERGAHYMKQNKKGDCGEFSFLFASWCRSLGIPCRTLVGSFAHGKMNAHVWNEFFVKGLGWIPVDSSIAASIHPMEGRIQHVLSGIKLNPKYYFGNLGGNYLAFSSDANPPLYPAYVDGDAPEGYKRMTWGEHNFAYGFDSHEGTAPYMQPIYLKFHGQPQKQSVADYLGKWRVREPLMWEGVRYVRTAGSIMAAGAFALSLIQDWFGFPFTLEREIIIPTIFTGLLLSLGSYILLRESNWILNTAFIIFLFMMINVI